MRTHAALSASLEKLLEADPSIQARLREEMDVHLIEESILSAARRHHIQIDEAELAAWLQTLDTLHKLSRIDASLLHDLETAADIEGVSSVIANAAQRHKMPLSIEALKAQLRAVHDNPTDGELSDEQLADVTGGLGLLVGGLLAGAVTALAVGVGAAGVGYLIFRQIGIRR